MFIFIFLASILFSILTLVSLCKSLHKENEEKNKHNIRASLFSATVSLLLLFNISIPSPTIYPLDSDSHLYTNSVDVTIQSDVGGLTTIYYSLDRSDPQNGLIYYDSIKISKSTTISARSKFLWYWSDIEQRTYIFDNDESQSDEESEKNHSFTANDLEEENNFITQSDFFEALRYIYKNEKRINEQKTKPIISSIYPETSFCHIVGTDEICLIEVISGFRDINYSRIYYFDEKGKILFSLIFNNEEEHRLYFYDDKLIRYKDENGEFHDINDGLEDFECQWTDLALAESYELFDCFSK